MFQSNMKCVCKNIEPIEVVKQAKKDRKEKKRKDKEKKRKEKQRRDNYYQNFRRYTPPWKDDNLPDQLVYAFEKHYELRRYLRKGGISKIWNAANSRCISAQKSPFLVLFHGEINTSKHSIGFEYPEIRGFDLEVDASPLGFTLRGWTRTVNGYYPKWGYSYNEYDWTKENCQLVGPKSSSDEQYQFTNAIAFRGKMYALSLQGTLAVIDVEDPQQFIAAISIPGVKRSIPSTRSKGFREYLVESDGEMLLVLLVSRCSMKVVDEVEVFRFDFSRKKGWIEVESLGDRTIFLGRKYYMCFPTGKSIGFEYAKNCIYFSDLTGPRWWVFDFGSRNISPAQL